ncbi:hypothetical protein ONS95_010951 [Cadophora gregata]|uniref:uncharacterized protein n=1 Tax=Cadophora gregata TaxID=51156 RepID=UPI0026DD2C5C|nr:uncharacterized protein ONS95_010951 [Cadophora gregata]KAK0119506.1 hypothetical protein ONS95_010951 [Cadophora gregata]
MVAIEDKAAPGTLQLIDATGQLHVKHSEAAHDVVLIPMPSGMIPNLIEYIMLTKKMTQKIR